MEKYFEVVSYNRVWYVVEACGKAGMEGRLKLVRDAKVLFNICQNLLYFLLSKVSRIHVLKVVF